MVLNFQRHEPLNGSSQPTLVLIHGLFGSLSNLGMLARSFEDQFQIIQIDVRNHGLSAHQDSMQYPDLAKDVLDTLNSIGVHDFSVIGHSMGGKIAIKLTEIAPDRLQKLVILDMAPFAYEKNNHDEIFKALFAVEKAKITSRKEATEIMKSYIHEEMVIQFLLKSFKQGQWLFNTQAIFDQYSQLISWSDIEVWTKPTLFIRGERSPYIGEIQLRSIYKQFLNVEIKSVAGAGHWLHAEKTDEVNNLIRHFLT